MIHGANGEDESQRFLIEDMEAFSAAKERQEKSWIPNKVAVAEAQATMKKAHISVRARSEAPMVSRNSHQKFILPPFLHAKKIRFPFWYVPNKTDKFPYWIQNNKEKGIFYACIPF